LVGIYVDIDFPEENMILAGLWFSKAKHHDNFSKTNHDQPIPLRNNHHLSTTIDHINILESATTQEMA